MPFSQVYDIIRVDGHKFDDEITSLDAATARAMLAKTWASRSMTRPTSS